MIMRVTSISATLIVLCILALGCGAQEPQTQGVEKLKTEKAPEAPEKPHEKVQKDTEPQGAQKPQGTQKPRQSPQKDHQRERRPGGVLVVSVVDGDTFDISPAVRGMDRVRMIGMDTPEVYGGTEPCGPEASEFTTRHLEGRRVTLGVGEDPKDPYGRLLAWVWLDGQMFNKMLVSAGLAEAVSYPPNTRYDQKLAQAEASARTPACADASQSSARASQTASATASPNATPPEASGGGDSRLHNGVDDVNCSDLSGPVMVD